MTSLFSSNSPVHKDISQNLKLLVKTTPDSPVSSYNIHPHSVLRSHVIIILNQHVLARVHVHVSMQAQIILSDFFLWSKMESGSTKTCKMFDTSALQGKSSWMCVSACACSFSKISEKPEHTVCWIQRSFHSPVFITVQVRRPYTNRDKITHWSSLLQNSSA